MNSDFEYIKNKFDNDEIKAPDSLSEDRILTMLAEAGHEEQASGEEEFTPVTAARPKRRRIGRYAAVAACALMVLAGVPLAYNVIAGAPDTSLVDGELYTFGSYGEIRRLIKETDKRYEEEVRGYSPYVEYADDGDSEIVYEESAPMVPAGGSKADQATGSGNDVSPDHSSTYLQVDGVDEADIVKTDGKYIYYVNEAQEVIVLSASDGKTEKVATIGSSGTENYVQDIYLDGDRLITVGTIYEDGDDGNSGIVVYDISDPSSPSVVSKFLQSGYIVSSRMTGGCVYLVTTDAIYGERRIVPQCTSGDGTMKDLPYNDICSVPKPAFSSYTVLSAIDVSTGKADQCRTKAVFGTTGEIYCNDHNLYAAVSEYDKDDQIMTRIVRAGFDGTDVAFDATALVRGSINDQFSMDEKDGYFRIATTSRRAGMDVNNLFVLDEKLSEKGSLTGFARNESIRAVRYLGDKAYVITYRQTDPLFVIDLSDPAKPEIDGEVKIEGFSTLLVPAGEGRLIGIGYDTDSNGMGGEYTDGLKLVLFDISDPSKPAVLDTKAFKEAESPAQSSHLALTVNSKEGWYAIPYGKFVAADTGADAETDGTASDYTSGVMVFSADDSISILDEHELSDKYLYRSIYIDGYIYALDGEGSTGSFKY